MSGDGAVTTGTYWNREQMSKFWEQLPDKLRSVLEKPHRVMRLSSDDVPAVVSTATIKKNSGAKLYLFTDVLAVVQGHVSAEYPLAVMWVRNTVVSKHTSTSFKLSLQCPEDDLTLHFKDVKYKQTWLICLAETIGDCLRLPVMCMNLIDGLLDSLKQRQQLSYTYQHHSEWKNGTYTGSWLSGKPHGQGEYNNPSNGIHYKGEFLNGKYHGNGLWMRCHWQKNERPESPLSCFSKIRHYNGQWKDGLMDGYGVAKYISGDEYHGDWMDGLRHGYGHLTETNVGGSCYYGDWSNDQCHGYGVYEDKSRHHRYLGMFQHNCYHGSGIIITSTGTYCEATFVNNKIVEHHDSLLMDPNGRSFLGKVGGYFQLVGKGELLLHNMSKVTGVFSGNWFEGKFQITNGSVDCHAGMETITGTDHHPPITNTDQRLGSIVTWTTPKWNTLFERCRKNLGFQSQPQGDSDNSLSFWNYWHLVSSQHKKSATPPVVHRTPNKSEIPRLKRANSLPIKFRRDSSGGNKSDRKGETLQGDITNSHRHSPLTITKTLPLSASPDNDRLHHHMKDYLEKAFADTAHHPLGVLMSQLEAAYHECYSGMGASRFLLPQGICDAKHMIQQLHSIVRLFFPRFGDDDQELSMYGFTRSSPSNDPDDYVSIATGYNLLQPLVFTRIFPTLFTLYILQHERDNQFYCRGLFSLNQLNCTDLARLLECPPSFVDHLSANNDSEVVKALQSCSKKLAQISTLFTATEILSHMVSTFTEVNDKVLQPLLSEAIVGADDLLPMSIYVTVKASVPLLGAILHYLYDFAFDHHEEGGDYTVTNYEVIYHYIVEEGKRLLQQHV